MKNLIVILALLGVIPAPKETSLSDSMAGEIKSERVRIKNDMAPEAYELKVTRHKVLITAGSDAGVFYARQTLAQELETEGGYRIGVIRDEPRFAWRGFMLDESRHFFGEEYVRKTLDLMAYYKFNKFHWHLTDAQGWRIEIKKYPLLTEVGAVGNHTDPKAPARFYTQEQIREIVAYAAERHIEVIPEFDMPGHATAANHAYPYLSGGKTEQRPDFTFNVGSMRTYAFISDVLDEIVALFPSQYIHIGGDEVHYGNACWWDNADIKELMEREGLKTLEDVEAWFMKKVTAMVREKGRTPIVWCDVLDKGIGAEDAEIMWWRHDRKDHLEAAAKGYRLIISPRLPLYFDFVQYPGFTEGRHLWKNEEVCCPLEAVYAFPEENSCGVEMTPELLAGIDGLQGNLWTETVDNPKRADHMVWPRLCAVAEAAWSAPEVKNYDDFLTRLDGALKHFDSLGVWYFDPRDPAARPELPSAQKAVATD